MRKKSETFSIFVAVLKEKKKKRKDSSLRNVSVKTRSYESIKRIPFQDKAKSGL